MSDLFKRPSEGEILVPITDVKHRVAVGRFFGAAMMLEALEKAEKQFGKLPGYNAALAVAQRECAEVKVSLYGMNTKAAAKAGVDLSQWRVYSLDGENVICHPIDLTGEEG
jgi:hypothetical protein